MKLFLIFPLIYSIHSIFMDVLHRSPYHTSHSYRRVTLFNEFPSFEPHKNIISEKTRYFLLINIFITCLFTLFITYNFLYSLSSFIIYLWTMLITFNFPNLSVRLSTFLDVFLYSYGSSFILCLSPC